MLPIALGVAAGLFLVVALLLYVAGKARARALADDIRAHVEPYLRRKAAEAGLPAEAPTWTARTPPEEIITYSVTLAGRLLDYERTGSVHHSGVTTKDFALAATQPVDDSAELAAAMDGTEKTTSKLRK